MLEILPDCQFISLGAGVQSSTMALMAARGEIGPMPRAAIFADTQAEPPSVYRWLDWLETKLPFPVVRVTAGDLGKAALAMRTTAKGRRFPKATIPVFTVSEDGAPGMVGYRSCTADFKIRPIVRTMRQMATVKRGTKTPVVTQWIGISTDEAARMKPAREPWLVSRWPLIEQRMTRADCLRWMEKRGYPQPPRSSCVFCPFHNAAEWRRLKLEEPDSFAAAVKFERDLQGARDGHAGFKSIPYLHSSRTPLSDVDFSTLEDHGQLNMFNGECEGMCGI